ncbi:GMC family oxidoreductase N-terminal domain-containing protein [Amycolatopsis nigrescens]|uniref:GMC family oxidoreductase N-terminal domain-containing protein n=1 Tax=Amycolatopsis nigrescens TaxID=381445 RepID=UPI00035C77C5|nr:GMC oxidoreductase [Amycolatopsis nigrescens]
MIPYSDRRLVADVFDLLVPADVEPSATQAGVLDWLDELAPVEHAELWRELLTPGFDALSRESSAPDDQLLRELQEATSREGWQVSPQEFVATVVELAAQGWYGRRDSPSWAGLGYTSAGKRPAGAPVRHVSLAPIGLADVAESYDIVITGAGAGGGVAARVLSEAGARVLLLDRGRFFSYAEMSRDHLANHRLPTYGHNTGPEAEGNPRVYAPPGGPERVVDRPYEPDWFNNAMTVGGGTRVYQGMAWRYQPDDFRMASRYGRPSGSSLADWPLSYQDLEPYYTRAEHELGVCGDGQAHRFQGRRSSDYPMGPLPENLEARVLRKGAEALGLTTGPVPLLLNSEPRDGRAACVRCGECVGFACPTDAKNGSHNTTIPLALATGSCTLATGARVERVLVGPAGRATGVVAVDLATGARRTISAGAVVLSSGAIETARLLLTSATDDYPTGLGNRSDQVGRNLQGHLYVSAFGLFEDQVQDGLGPGVSIATADYTHDLGGDGIGGGVLANETVKLPVLFWYWALAPDAPRWGREGKHAVRDAYLRTGHIQGPIQEIPSPETRVTLAPEVRDAHGNAVVRIAGELHPESVRSARLLQDRACEWMAASGAERVWRNPSPIAAKLTVGQHQAGTARMGTDPATSVTDPYGRVHGHPGLWVLDGSLHVTNGGVNPVLTILALAYRGAERLARNGS